MTGSGSVSVSYVHYDQTSDGWNIIGDSGENVLNGLPFINIEQMFDTN